MRIEKYTAPLVLLISGLLLVTSTASSASHDINVDKGVMLEGYDVVAYHTLGKATRGSEGFQTDWLGGRWYFASQQHLDLFVADPERYLPQYGGYCALSFADGKEHGGIDPRAWKIVEGKLYLFYGRRAVSRWNIDQPHVQEANNKWDKARAGLLGE